MTAVTTEILVNSMAGLKESLKDESVALNGRVKEVEDKVRDIEDKAHSELDGQIHQLPDNKAFEGQ